MPVKRKDWPAKHKGCRIVRGKRVCPKKKTVTCARVCSTAQGRALDEWLEEQLERRGVYSRAWGDQPSDDASDIYDEYKQRKALLKGTPEQHARNRDENDAGAYAVVSQAIKDVRAHPERVNCSDLRHEDYYATLLEGRAQADGMWAKAIPPATLISVNGKPLTFREFEARRNAKMRGLHSLTRLYCK